MAAFDRIPAAVVEEGVLRHVGNPVVEQRALASGSGLAVLGDRAVLAVTGEDRLSWLDSLSSQAVARLTPGHSSELLILDPQGHVEHAAAVLDDGATTWLIADRADAPGLADWLRRMRFRLRVDPRDASDEFAVIGGTAAAVRRRGVAAPDGVPLVWHDPWPRGAIAGRRRSRRSTTSVIRRVASSRCSWTASCPRPGMRCATRTPWSAPSWHPRCTSRRARSRSRRCVAAPRSAPR